MKPTPTSGWPMMKIDLCGVVALAGAAAAAWMLGYGPALEHRAAQHSQRAQVEDVRAEAASVEGSARMREDWVKQHKATITRLGVLLKPVGQLNQRIQRIAELADQSGVRLNQIGPGSAEALGQAVTVPVKLLGTGSYADARRFLASLRERFPDMSVCGIKLNRGSALLEAEKPPVSVEFNLVWYALPAGGEGQGGSASAEAP